MNICENPTPLKCYKYLIYKQLITETMSSKKHLSILKFTAFFSLLTSVLYISCNIRNHYCISFMNFMNFLYVNTYICLYVLPFLYHHPTPANCLRTPGKVLTDDLIANTFLKELNQNILSLSLVTDPLPPVYVTVIYGIIKQTKVLNLAYFLMLFS